MKPYQNYTVSIKAQNKFGVLTRVLAQIRREGCNIISLNVAETIEKSISTINIKLESYNYLFEDINNRLKHLSCVLEVHICDIDGYLSKEYALIRIDKFDDIVFDILKKYNATTIEDCVIYEISSSVEMIDSMRDELVAITKIEIVRSGVITIER